VTNTTGTVLGTVSYLAPEQIEHGTADPRVDVYACGVVLYEMLTGDRPHGGDSPATVLYKHIHEDVPPPSATVPGLAYRLDQLVASATARTPDLRPQDAVALLAQAREVRAALSADQLDALPPGAFPADHRSISEDRTSVIPRALTVQRPLPVNEDEDRIHRTSRLETPPPLPPRRRGRRSRRGPLTVVVAVLLILGVGTGVWYINSGQFTKVPLVLAKTQTQATRQLQKAGLDLGAVKHAYSDTVQRGTVISSDPAPGTRIRENRSVALTISDGPETVQVPDVSARPLGEARARLKKSGLEPGMVTRQFSEDVAKGSVISTTPEAGTKRHAGSAIALVVSKGSPVDVPDVTGEDLASAKSDLEGAGLTVKVASAQINSQYDKGQVAAQTPAGDSQAADGDTVTLTLSKGPEMVKVPDVTGDSVDDGHKALEGAGFKVEEDRGLLGLFGDTVKNQSVKGGDMAPKGSTITIKIR
ncbi:MAG: PASTA domain-containing protein, partial [Streptomyces sp.]|nr:PASTA domain-containing protein [Streptomyces sp.]